MSWIDPFDMYGMATSMYKSPYENVSGTGQDVEDMLMKYYGGYIGAGNEALNQLTNQYMMLLNNPGQVNANMMSGFEESPGYQWQVDQAMNASNNAAAAGGMTATPSHQQQSQMMASDLANQEYYNYMDQMNKLYGMGMSTAGDINQMGYNANSAVAGGMGNYMAQQSRMQYMDQAMTNQMLAAGIGGLLSFF